MRVICASLSECMGRAATMDALPADDESAMTRLPTFFRQSRNSADAALSRRLEESIESAGYWVQRMPREAARLARRARVCTVAAAVLALLAGLLVWPVIAESSQLTAQVLLSALAGLAALACVAPHLMGLADRSDESIRLCATYATMYRELLDTKTMLNDGSIKDPSHVADILGLFDRIHARNGKLALPAGTESADAAPAGPFALEGGRPEEHPPDLAWREPAEPSMPPETSHTRPAVAPAGIDAQDLLAALLQALTNGHLEVQQRMPAIHVYRRFPFRARIRRSGRTLPGGTRVLLDPSRMRITGDGRPAGAGFVDDDGGVSGAGVRLLPGSPGSPGSHGWRGSPGAPRVLDGSTSAAPYASV